MVGVFTARLLGACGEPGVPLQLTRSITQPCCSVGRQSARDHLIDVPSALTLRPTLEEFTNTIQYLEDTLKYSDRYGIVKVIPPEGWCPPAPNIDSARPFETKLQRISTLQVSVPLP